MKAILTLLMAFAPIFLFAQLDTDGQLKDQDISSKAQVYATDLIVQGSACVGFDCSTSESFGSDTHRIKENNLRIHFDDTSASATFPSNDWRIVVNDNTNGGNDYFMVQDATSNQDIFRLEAGAGNHALRIASNGYAGFGEVSPTMQIHITDGNSPAVRLEQDGSGGWASQSWDIAGNETNFFIRDVTNGSKLPFKIKPNSPDDAIFIHPTKVVINDGKQADLDFIVETSGSVNTLFVDSSEDRVGIGTSSPDTTLHVVGKVKIVDGNQQQGYVLTSDATGQGSWAPISEELPTGGSNGQILSTDGSGNYSWVNDNTADSDNDPNNEIELPAGGSNGQVLSTDGSGVYSWIDNESADGDTDPTNEIELPAGGMANQMLMTDGASNHSWNYVESMSDADANTKIQVEESSNENKIRFDVDGTEAMIIDAAGNVGIGTDMPEHKLHVAGDIAKTGSLVGVSDLRLKDNITSISNARNIINSLDGKAYNFRKNEFQDLNLPSGKQYGFVAQDVEKVMADLVTDNVARTTNGNGEELSLKGVNYEQLIPILVNALKEQDQLIKKQNQEMIEMKGLLNKVLEKLEIE